MGLEPELPKPSLLNALDWCRTGIWISWTRRHQHLPWVPVHFPSQAIASITSPIFFQNLLIWYRSVRLGCYWFMSAVYFSLPISLSLCSDRFRTIDFVIMVRYLYLPQTKNFVVKLLKFRGALNLEKIYLAACVQCAMPSILLHWKVQLHIY